VPVQAAIVETKRRFPDFGLRRVRDYLARFLHLKVSEGGVATVVAAMDPPPATPPAPRRRRRSEEPRRFERSRPGELWQSDITSYLLGRHHRRVYLTVFLDDFSRYVVSWNLQLHQRQELVTDCLLAGIEAFGKPREVLTDQGRQYFAWRGKSDFQKLLIKEGIQHVVARAHHPETVGKCERLWKTVGEELVDRAHPEDLEETRERLGHFFRHYNHFRPHQGLKGLTPADRFFGAEERLRRELLDAQAHNALRLALGERPVARSFLVGSLDGLPVAVRTGRDGLVIETGDPARAGGKDGGDGGREDAGVPEADAHRDAGAGGGGGAGAVGGGERGGAEEGARDGGGDPAHLARQGDEGRGGGGAAGDGAPAVAAEPDGGERDGGGALAPAAEPAGPGALGGGGAAAEGGGAREGARGDAGAGEDPRSDARPPRGEEPRCGTPGSEGTRSDAGSGSTGEACGEGEERSPGATA
jgi:transposase InsO family protein